MGDVRHEVAADGVDAHAVRYVVHHGDRAQRTIQTCDRPAGHLQRAPRRPVQVDLATLGPPGQRTDEHLGHGLADHRVAQRLVARQDGSEVGEHHRPRLVADLDAVTDRSQRATHALVRRCELVVAGDQLLELAFGGFQPLSEDGRSILCAVADERQPAGHVRIRTPWKWGAAFIAMLPGKWV